MTILFKSAASLLLAFATLSALAAPSPVTGLAYDAAPYYATTQPSTPATANTPYNQRHRPQYGGPLDGVARLVVGNPASGFFLCSGALIDSFHILTAAHCVTDGNGVLTATVGSASFGITPTGTYTGLLSADVAISGIYVHPGWNGDYIFHGNDLAVLKLATAAPESATRYDIYRGPEEVGQVSTKSGWGIVSQGDVGTPGALGVDWRTGQNRWEMTAAGFWSVPGINPNPNILMYDFDNGLAANDAFGIYFGRSDLGLGDMEVDSAPGDSGGPSFIDGKVAGITSFGLTFTNGTDANGNRLCNPAVNPDILCGLNSSFGEFAGDTRVSAYAAWIDAVRALPEPASPLLVALTLPLAFIARRRRDPR
jgi:secreted trypsin-like serine protease